MSMAAPAGLWQRTAAAEWPGRVLHWRKRFRHSNARSCAMSQQARFSRRGPPISPKGPVVNLAEEAGYDDAQARLAACSGAGDRRL